MDINASAFFRSPPRIASEVTAAVREMALRMVTRAAEHALALNAARVQPRHVRLISIVMAQDPMTRLSRNGLCVQETKVKPVVKVLKRAVDDAEKAIARGAANGDIDDSIVRSTRAVWTKLGVPFDASAAVCMAACVAEVCGIMLNSTQRLMNDSTVMRLSDFEAHSTTYSLSSGGTCANTSLRRFLTHLFRPTFAESASRVDQPAAEPLRTTLTNSKLRRWENTGVSFREEYERPSTPNTCFWED